MQHAFEINIFADFVITYYVNTCYSKIFVVYNLLTKTKQNELYKFIGFGEYKCSRSVK